MPSIIVLDALSAEGITLLDAAPGITYEVRTGLKGDDLKNSLAEFDGAICRSGVTIDAASLEGNRRLKAIVRAGVGTDNIDKVAATRLGIIVMNTPTGNTLSTAEHAFALMLALSRNIAPANQSLIEGRWDRKSYMGSQLADKVLGIVGLGRIGREVAKRAQAFEMKVMGFDPFMSAEMARDLKIEPVSNVVEMLPWIDYLTVHTPLTPETTGLIDSATLELIKPGCRLINCARGGIYNEEAMLAGLKSGKLGGVALDVYENEPCTDSPLFGMPNVLCTPHLGASTEEAQTQVAVEAVHLLTNFLTSGEIRHAVNSAALDPATLADLRGHLELNHRLGLLMAQWHRGTPQRLSITYRGDVADKNTKLLTAAFCAGLLENAMDEEVNVVNSELLMKDRGIEISSQSVSEQLAFSSSILVNLETDKRNYVAAGTLFGTEMPRLIKLDDYRMEAYLDGLLLLFTHSDVPGIIGSVGTAFGKHKVNIAQMAVGRAGSAPGGQALGILNLDNAPSEAALQEIAAIEGVQSAEVITLPDRGERPTWLQA